MSWLIFIFALQSFALIDQPSSEDRILNKGLQLEQQEQYEQALRVWANAYRELETPSLAIGRAHIRLATEQKLQSHYQTSATLYQWGLSADQIAPNAEALAKELQMLEPLVADDTFDRWQQLLEQEDPALYEELSRFWQNRDPTLVTTYNERLLEHWERIAYAREHFTRYDDPPYGTDDRGEYWVRYGTPDRQYDGRLKATQGQVTTVCMVLQCDSEIMGNAVFELDQRPYYDIWIYEKPNQNMKYNLVLIFGESPSTGFGRIEILEDFIPSSAFSFSNRYSAPSLLTESAGKPSKVMTPGMVMQWIYYKQLAATDFYFANRFEEMTFEWDRVDPQNPALDKHAGHVQKQQTQMETIKNMKAAPEEVSTYEKELPSIPLEIHQYRLLDEQNQPVFVTFLESNPQPVFLRDLAVNEDSMFSDDSVTVGQAFSHYELYHGLQIRGSGGEVLSQSRLPTTLALDSTNTEPSHSVFTVPPLSNEQSARLYAELHNRHPQSVPPIDSPFPNSLRGQGKTELEQPDPLRPTGRLQMGDLILGYQMQEDPQGDGLFPFYVANDRQIPANENLAVHVEVYNMQLGTGGIGRLQLSYQILPVNALGWTQERKQEFSLTLNLETTAPRYTEDLEIQTRELPPGRYVMRMQAEDQQSGQQAEREIEFEVVE